jgi:hypothetical protein
MASYCSQQNRKQSIAIFLIYIKDNITLPYKETYSNSNVFFI